MALSSMEWPLGQHRELGIVLFLLNSELILAYILAHTRFCNGSMYMSSSHCLIHSLVAERLMILQKAGIDSSQVIVSTPLRVHVLVEKVLELVGYDGRHTCSLVATVFNSTIRAVGYRVVPVQLVGRSQYMLYAHTFLFIQAAALG